MKIRCVTCYGKGFRNNGFTMADRTVCHRCNGAGEHDSEYTVTTKNKKTKSYKYNRDDGKDQLSEVEAV